MLKFSKTILDLILTLHLLSNSISQNFRLLFWSFPIVCVLHVILNLIGTILEIYFEILPAKFNNLIFMKNAILSRDIVYNMSLVMKVILYHI